MNRSEADPGRCLDLAEQWTSLAAGALLSALASLEHPEAAKGLLESGEQAADVAEDLCRYAGVL